MHTLKNKQQKEQKQNMNEKKPKKKQVEEEEMLVEACRIEVSITIEEEKLIVEKNAMKNRHQKICEVRINKKESRIAKWKECNAKSTTTATKRAH